LPHPLRRAVEVLTALEPPHLAVRHAFKAGVNSAGFRIAERRKLVDDFCHWLGLQFIYFPTLFNQLPKKRETGSPICRYATVMHLTKLVTGVLASLECSQRRRRHKRVIFT